MGFCWAAQSCWSRFFAIPGLGKYMVDAIKANNYPAVQGGVLYMSVVFSIVNLFVDLIYAFVDPRIKAMFKLEGMKRGPKLSSRLQKGRESHV